MRSRHGTGLEDIWEPIHDFTAHLTKVHDEAVIEASRMQIIKRNFSLMTSILSPLQIDSVHLFLQQFKEWVPPKRGIIRRLP